MTSGKPSCYRLIVSIGHTHISEDTMFHPPFSTLPPQRELYGNPYQLPTLVIHPHLRQNPIYRNLYLCAEQFHRSCTSYISIKTSQSVPKFQFAVSRSFEVLVQDDCPETFGNNVSRTGILHAVNRAF